MGTFQGPRARASGSQDTKLQLMLFGGKGGQVRGMQDSDAADLQFTNLKVLNRLYCGAGGLDISGDDGESAPTAVNIAGTPNQGTASIFKVQYEDSGLNDAFEIGPNGEARFNRDVWIHANLHVDGSKTSVVSEEVNIGDAAVIYGGGTKVEDENASTGWIAKQVEGTFSFTASRFDRSVGVITMLDDPAPYLSAGDLFFVHGSQSNDGLYEAGEVTKTSIVIQPFPTVSDTFGVKRVLTDEVECAAEVSKSAAGLFYYDWVTSQWSAKRHAGGSVSNAWVAGAGFAALDLGSLCLYGKGKGSNFVALQAPVSVPSNIIWTLPGSCGTPGQVLCDVEGDGTLGWVNGVSTVGGDKGEMLCWDGDSWAVLKAGAKNQVLVSSDDGIPYWSGDLDIPGNLNVDGEVNFSGRVASTIDPVFDAAIDLGSAGNDPLRLRRVHAEVGGCTLPNYDNSRPIDPGAPVMLGNLDQIGVKIATVGKANKGAFIGFAVDGVDGNGTTAHGFIATSGFVTVSKSPKENWKVNDPVWLSPTMGQVTNNRNHKNFIRGDYLVPCGYAASTGRSKTGTIAVVVGGLASRIEEIKKVVEDEEPEEKVKKPISVPLTALKDKKK